MISRLYLDNCFRHFDRTFTFDKGLTGIVGPNESGKSLIVEMIRYALFGSAALRGKAEDYKGLHVELDFTIAGENFTVVRKGVKVTLEGDRQASGTKPVNEAIRSILGYDLTVFDVANACNQGNIEALSDMQPAARKTMVDRTIGLDQLDGLIKLCGSEGNTLKREADAIRSTLVEPVQPVTPEGYRPSSEIIIPLDAQREFHELSGWLKQIPREPVHPGDAPVLETSDELRTYQENRRTTERSIRYLEEEVRSLEPEVYTEEQLTLAEEQHEAADRWRQFERLMAQGHICCPECDHSWPVADLTGFEDVVAVSPPDLSKVDITKHRARIGNNQRISDLHGRLVGLNVPDDRANDLGRRQAWEADVEIYSRQQHAFDRYNQELPQKKARHEELLGIEQQVQELQAELEISRQFERDQKQYNDTVVLYEQNQEVVAELTVKSDEYLRARELIQALKVSVKSHLLPSLNKVASVLLSQMTGGERYLVEVDEDFEITIDGQSIKTLSGSGKAVANLAIRIALGQILTNKVFSVFLADEVDAAMDDERAGHTAEALSRLTEIVGQVFLVTHKSPETDQQFELKKS
jgi:DNA repair exonuclease SbcCD ATPase subunit